MIVTSVGNSFQIRKKVDIINVIEYAKNALSYEQFKICDYRTRIAKTKWFSKSEIVNRLTKLINN